MEIASGQIESHRSRLDWHEHEASWCNSSYFAGAAALAPSRCPHPIQGETAAFLLLERRNRRVITK